MIRLCDVHYRYPGADWILNGINLTVDRGERVLVCGASGSGKSTLACLLNGLIPHFFGGTLRGSVFIDGEDCRDLPPADRFSRIGLVLQNSDAQLFNSTVEDELAFGLESLGLKPPEIQNRILEVTDALQIAHLLDRSPASLSGGEKRLVSIASMACLRPKVLVLDEPYAHMDNHGISRLRETLSRLQNTGITLLVIEQRVGEFLSDFDRCLVIDKGRIRFDGRPEKAETAIRQQHLIPTYPQYVPGDSKPGDPILSVEKLSSAIEGKTTLKEVSFKLHQGERVTLAGRNGAGKTTLIRHLNGLAKPSRGRILYRGRPVGQITPAKRAEGIGISFQNPNDQFFRPTVREELHAGPAVSLDSGKDSASELFELFEIAGLQDQSPYRLSEGQKKRVALASIAAMNPEVLVLDEPTVGQDGRFREVLAGYINKLSAIGYTLLVVTHDIRFARATTDRCILLDEGRIVEDGPTGTLLPEIDSQIVKGDLHV